MIETLDDIIESLANAMGIYGACPDPTADKCVAWCRPCWVSDTRARIDAAIEVERKLNNDSWGRARKPPAVVSAIRSAIARAAWGKLSAEERKARQQRVWAKRKAASPSPSVPQEQS